MGGERWGGERRRGGGKGGEGRLARQVNGLYLGRERVPGAWKLASYWTWSATGIMFRNMDGLLTIWRDQFIYILPIISLHDDFLGREGECTGERPHGK